MCNLGVLRGCRVRAVCLFVLFFMATGCAWASEDDLALQTVSGKVIDVDSVKSMITVRYVDPVSGVSNELDIAVPENAKIMNGTETESFLDIEQFDSVTVTYYDDGANGLKAKEILELNPVDA